MEGLGPGRAEYTFEVWEGSSWLSPTTKHKALSVRPISITKSAWFVLEACSPLSCASLTPTPSHPGPPAAHVGLPTLFGACILYIVCVWVYFMSVPNPLHYPPDRGLCLWAQQHLARMPGLPAPQWSRLPASISPLLIPLETGWRPNTLGVWGRVGDRMGWVAVLVGGDRIRGNPYTPTLCLQSSGSQPFCLVYPKPCQMNSVTPSLTPFTAFQICSFEFIFN